MPIRRPLPPHNDPVQSLNRSEWVYLACDPMLGSLAQPYVFRFEQHVGEADVRAAVRRMISAFPRLRAVLEPTRRRMQWRILPDDEHMDQLFDLAFRVEHVALDDAQAVLRWHELAANDPLPLQHGLGLRAQFVPHPQRPGLIFSVSHLLMDGRSMVHCVESLMRLLNGKTIDDVPLATTSMLPAIFPEHWWQWPGKLFKAWRHQREQARELRGYNVIHLPRMRSHHHTSLAVQHHQTGCDAKDLSALARSLGGSANSLLLAAIGTAMLDTHGKGHKSAALVRVGVDLRRYFPAESRPLLGNYVSVFDVLLPQSVPEAERVRWVDDRVRAGLARYDRREMLLPLLLYEMLGWLRPHDYSRLIRRSRRLDLFPSLSCHATNVGSVDAFNQADAQVRLSELYPIVGGIVPLLVLLVVNGQQVIVTSHQRDEYFDGDVQQMMGDVNGVLHRWLASASSPVKG